MINNTKRIVAKKIADALMTNGCGNKADRLVMIRRMPKKDDRMRWGDLDLGGWCKQAVIDQILKVLNESDPQ